MREERDGRGAPEHSGEEGARWVTPFLFVLAAIAEILSMLLMTLYRYHNQGLPAEFLDLSKTANLLGFLLAAPFVLLFLLLAVLRRFHSMRIAAAAVTMSTVGLVALTVGPMLAETPRMVLYGIYLIYKAVELSTFMVITDQRRRTPLRAALTAGGITLTIGVCSLLVVILTVLLSPIGSSIIDRPRKEYDAAVILGAAVWSRDKPSPVLRERIRTGYDLLQSGAVRFLVLTGGNAPYELPEAEVARRELLKLGVDPTRIVMETHTGSTMQQILFIRDELLKQGWTSFIIVSDQFHLKRALEIAEFNGLDAHGVSSESPLGPENLVVYHLRESLALILYWMFGM